MTLDGITAHLHAKAAANVNERLKKAFDPAFECVPTNLVMDIDGLRRDCTYWMQLVKSAIFEATIEAERKRVTDAFLDVVAQLEVADPRLAAVERSTPIHIHT